MKNALALLLLLILCLPVSADPSRQGLAEASVSDKITEAVRQYALRHNQDWKGGEINVVVSGAEKLDEKYGSQDKVRFEVPKQYEISKVTSSMIMPVAAYSGEKELGRATVIVRFEVIKEVVVAAGKIGKRAEIGAGDIELKKVNIATYPNKYFTSKPEVLGKLANGIIPQGTVLLNWMVKDTPLVLKGSKVKVTVKADNLLIESSGVALADGLLNEIIAVRRSDSKEVFQAQVVSPENVEVKI
jgi:flagella basal body P-ring formation protein FlgA